MAASHTGESGDHGFQIAPMVDVVFVLLLFFMACAGIGEKLLTVPVPAPVGEDPSLVESIFVDIDSAGNISVNGTTLSAGADARDLTRLREFLAKATATTPDDPVILRPSGDARHERVLAVVDLCRSLRVRKLIFA